MQQRIRVWLCSGAALVQLGRMHFLAGGAILHCLGIMMAVYSGAKLNAAAALWGQLAITATQLMTHYANDYFDLAADRANLTPTNWSGGSRVLVKNRLRPRTALIVSLLLAGIAIVAILILSLLIRPGAGTFCLLAAAGLIAWFYSAPPLRLHSRGLGELATVIAVPLLTPMTGYYLQTGAITLLPVLAVLPLCCFQFAMLLSIEIPDAAGDRQEGKRTLVVRLGTAATLRLYTVLLLLAYAILPLLVAAGLPSTAALAIVMLFPLAAGLLWRVHRGDWYQPARWNAPAFYTIVLLVATAAAELGAFMLLTGLR